jgi:hypothetical protein
MALSTTDALAAEWSRERGTIDGRHFIHEAIAVVEWDVYVSSTVGKKELSKAGLEEEPISQRDFRIMRGQSQAVYFLRLRSSRSGRAKSRTGQQGS